MQTWWWWYDWNHVRKFVMFSDNNLYEITRKCKFDYTDGVHHNVTFEFKILQETNNLRITKRTSKWQVHFHSTTIIPSLTNVYRYLLKNNSYWTSGINWQKKRDIITQTCITIMKNQSNYRKHHHQMTVSILTR